MGLFNNRFVEGLAARRLVKEFPMIGNAIAWLTDPTAPGRKRGVAALFFCVAESLRFVDTLIARACEKALFVGAICELHVSIYASWFDVGYQVVQTYFVPGAETVGVLVGIWGLIHGATRSHIVTPLAR